MSWLQPTLLGVLALASLVRSQETCLAVEEEPYLLFGTKTAYIFANRGLPNINRAHDVPGCEPIAFWLMNKHGSHNPESDELDGLHSLANLRDNIVNNYRSGNFRNNNQRICEADLNQLEQWQWNPRHNQSFAGDLTSDGYISTQQLAQAWRQKYPGLLTDNRHNYWFKFVNSKRLSTTFSAFLEGLFKTQADGYEMSMDNVEKVLRPQNTCDAWIKNVKENKETLAQREIFESKQEYREMLTNVSRRLGFNYDIESSALRDIYLMCRYNKAWDVTKISPWCAAFTKEDLRRLEYAEDLETYYKYGYGNEINKKIGCVHIKDLMNFFRNHVDSEVPQQPRVSIQLVDAEDLLLALGAVTHRDTAPLTGDNYHLPAIQSRLWSSSSMAPFNGNFAAVLYKCTLNGNFQIKEKYQVLFLENEKPISLEGCRVGLCDWSRVTSMFAEVADSCDLKVCNSASRSGHFVALFTALAAMFVQFLK